MTPLYDSDIVEDQMYNMARVGMYKSGTKPYIYVFTKNDIEPQLGPRIKVSNISPRFSFMDNFVISIDSVEPKITSGNSVYTNEQNQDIINWIKLNYDYLIKYWNSMYDDDQDFYDHIKTI